jgi:site-specific DNA-adenine methylase
MSMTDFKAKMNKSKINKYKINNNNKTNTKHEFNVIYERYKQDNGQFGKGSVCLYMLRFGI